MFHTKSVMFHTKLNITLRVIHHTKSKTLSVNITLRVEHHTLSVTLRVEHHTKS